MDVPLLSEVFLIKLFNSHRMSIVFFLVVLLLFYLFISTFLELPLYFFDFVDIVPLELEGFILFFSFDKKTHHISTPSVSFAELIPSS